MLIGNQATLTAPISTSHLHTISSIKKQLQGNSLAPSVIEANMLESLYVNLKKEVKEKRIRNKKL